MHGTVEELFWKTRLSASYSDFFCPKTNKSDSIISSCCCFAVIFVFLFLSFLNNSRISGLCCWRFATSNDPPRFQGQSLSSHWPGNPWPWSVFLSRNFFTFFSFCSWSRKSEFITTLLPPRMRRLFKGQVQWFSKGPLSWNVTKGHLTWIEICVRDLLCLLFLILFCEKITNNSQL